MHGFDVSCSSVLILYPSEKASTQNSQPTLSTITSASPNNSFSISFDGSDFPKSLDEDVFDEWLEKGRQSKISYSILMIVWDAFENDYVPVYTENREELQKYEKYQTATGRESLVAAYDLYSESRIS